MMKGARYEEPSWRLIMQSVSEWPVTCIVYAWYAASESHLAIHPFDLSLQQQQQQASAAAVRLTTPLRGTNQPNDARTRPAR